MLDRIRLIKEPHIFMEGLTVYNDPATEEKWVQIRNENDAETRLMLLLRDGAKHIEVSRGYLLAPPALDVPTSIVRRSGIHSAFDPYGGPWRTYPEIGAVLHCHNRISVDEHDGSTAQSIQDRLYAHVGAAPPGFAQALALTQTQNGCMWYTMNTHKAKRQGLLSHCACCVPASVMLISWERTSSKEHMQHCQETLHAWIGMNFKMLPGEHRSTATLPSV